MTHPYRHTIHCHTTGDLVQHMPYCAAGKGYYYFRPYHVMHVFAQQEMVTRWGGDPRNPYDNTLFGRVYQYMNIEPHDMPEEIVVPDSLEPVN